MQSFLITGSNEKGRLEKAEEVMGKKIAKQENNPDFFLLQMRESSIGIDDIRNLQKFLQLKPFREKTKICFIKEAQNLTVEAQSAMLKTLEEMPKSCQIILTAPDVSYLLPTVSSRCQIIRLSTKIGTELKEGEQAEILETFNQLLKSSTGKRIKIIEEQEIAKDRETTIKWLDKLTFVIRQQLLSCFLEKPCHCENFAVGEDEVTAIRRDPAEAGQSRSRSPRSFYSLAMTSSYLHILQAITKSKKYLSANCNVKLTLDNLVLPDVVLPDDVWES